MAVQPGLYRTWSETPKTGFLATKLIWFSIGYLHSNIRITRPCGLHPFNTPHFYIVKRGLTGVYIFLVFALKHRVWVLVRTVTLYVLSKNKKNITIFHLKITIFTAVKNHNVLHKHVLRNERQLFCILRILIGVKMTDNFLMQNI